MWKKDSIFALCSPFETCIRAEVGTISSINEWIELKKAGCFFKTDYCRFSNIPPLLHRLGNSSERFINWRKRRTHFTCHTTTAATPITSVDFLATTAKLRWPGQLTGWDGTTSLPSLAEFNLSQLWERRFRMRRHDSISSQFTKLISRMSVNVQTDDLSWGLQ